MFTPWLNLTWVVLACCHPLDNPLTLLLAGRCDDEDRFQITASINNGQILVPILSHDDVCSPSYMPGRCPRYMFMQLIKLHTTKLVICTCITPVIQIVKAMHPCRPLIERASNLVMPEWRMRIDIVEVLGNATYLTFYA